MLLTDHTKSSQTAKKSNKKQNVSLWYEIFTYYNYTTHYYTWQGISNSRPWKVKQIYICNHIILSVSYWTNVGPNNTPGQAIFPWRNPYLAIGAIRGYFFANQRNHEMLFYTIMWRKRSFKPSTSLWLIGFNNSDYFPFHTFALTTGHPMLDFIWRRIF